MTADDVGLHPGMTAGAIEAHRDGIVTACSVVANGVAFDDAIKRLCDVPRLDVGIHLTLVEERPVAEPAGVASLLGENGKFLKNFRQFSLRYALRQIRMSEVERELRAQIERILAAGVSPLHCNGHQHLHMLPAIFAIVQRLAMEYRIPYIRIPNEVSRDGAKFGRRASLRFLVALGRRARQRVSNSDFATPDATIGIHESGFLDSTRLRRILRGLDGLVELVTHPGRGAAAIAQDYDWGYTWDAETNALCDPSIRQLLDDSGVKLVSMREIVDARQFTPLAPPQRGEGQG